MELFGHDLIDWFDNYLTCAGLPYCKLSLCFTLQTLAHFQLAIVQQTIKALAFYSIHIHSNSQPMV